MATIKATKPFENRFKVEKGRQMLPFFFCGIDAIDGIDVFECPVPVRESVLVRSVPSAFATIKGLTGLKGPKGILSDDSGLFCGRVVVDDAFECGDEVIVG